MQPDDPMYPDDPGPDDERGDNRSTVRSGLVVLIGVLVVVGLLGAFQLLSENGDDDVSQVVSPGGGAVDGTVDATVDATPPSIDDDEPTEPGPVDAGDSNQSDTAATTADGATTTPPPESEPEPLPGMPPIPDPIPMPPVEQFASVGLRLEAVLDIAHLTGMEWSVLEGAYYAVTQDGLVHRIPEDLNRSEVELDLRSEVTELLPLSERGLLGATFDPRDGRMFLHFTDRSNDSHVVSYELVDGRPDPDTRRQVLFQDQPGPGHQGGDMQFDQEGHLFIAFGDGGGSRGRDAQDYSSIHGSILRVVPRLDGDGYDIPADNPYVGVPEHREEIWVKGLRNPWRFWINHANGDIWLGDVGEDTLESLYLIPAGTSGQNFGWYWFEGSKDRGIGGIPAGLELTPPVYEYDRSVGVAIIGGLVYHGTEIPELRGAYVFADMSGPVFAMGNDSATQLGLGGRGVITGFVETPEHEVLVTTLSRGLFRLLPA